jgi:alpha,alpha-trehalose phosphorylase
MPTESSNSHITQASWLLEEKINEIKNPLHSETLFSQANGYIGIRGTLEEGIPGSQVSCEGIYLNGVYSCEPIPYGEIAYGFATHNQKLLQVPNCKAIVLSAGTETPVISDHNRQLDQASGILARSHTLTFSDNSQVQVSTERFVSMSEPNLLCIKYQLSSLDFSGQLTLEAALDCDYGPQSKTNLDDPRAGQLSIREAISLLESHQEQDKIELYHSVQGTDFVVSSSCLDKVSGSAGVTGAIVKHELRPANRYHISMQPGQTFELVRFSLYHHDHDVSALKEQQNKSIKRLAKHSYHSLREQHCTRFDQFWQSANITISGDSQTEQGLRFSMFHLFQSVGRSGTNSIAAKGLCGPGYDGHYFWDTEIYIIPFFTFTQPDIAKQLLMYRYNTLDAARERAKQMSYEQGALFAWRTIGGEECSAYYPASTAQYHINAAVAYAIKTYYQATDDWQFLLDFGAEVVLETARIWLSLGHFNPAKDGQFCIDGVTGPDEYTAVVNNNFYTNFMARQHLKFALEVCARMLGEQPKRYAQLCQQLDFSKAELEVFGQAVDRMYLPFDTRLNIHAQDDTFLAKKPWDLANQPVAKTPLLLHYHPLVIYRHQVLKQADVILAMYLADDEFSLEQKARNLAYYEPLTTHDSTLSTCIHSIEYAEVGDMDKAYEYFADSARMDLDNLHHNTEYGVHTACMAGSWNSVVFGFLGMRVRQEMLHFRPQLPKHWTAFSLQIQFKGRQLAISVTPNSTTFSLVAGDEIEFYCDGQTVQLKAISQTVTLGRDV